MGESQRLDNHVLSALWNTKPRQFLVLPKLLQADIENSPSRKKEETDLGWRVGLGSSLVRNHPFISEPLVVSGNSFLICRAYGYTGVLVGYRDR